MTLALAEAGANFRLLYAARRRQDLALARRVAGADWRSPAGCFVSEEGRRVDIDGGDCSPSA